jgi:DNA-binding NarL/FixJ family response regulator
MTIALIEDDKVISEQFASFFKNSDDFYIRLVVSSVEEFQSVWLNSYHLDLLLLDITLPGISGLEALPLLKKLLPTTDIVMFTVQEEDDTLIRAFCNGAVGYLVKEANMNVLKEYLDVFQRGGAMISAKIAHKIFQLIRMQQKTPIITLNEKEYEVLELLSEGWSYKLIADRANLSVDGVRFYIKRIYRALNVNSKGEALRIYYTGEITK